MGYLKEANTVTQQLHHPRGQNTRDVVPPFSFQQEPQKIAQLIQMFSVGVGFASGWKWRSQRKGK